MASMEFNRRLFAWVLWICAGLGILILLTSCVEMPAAAPAATTTPSPTAAITTVTTSPTPRPSYLVTSAVLEIRTGPGEVNPNAGYLKHGQLVTIYSTAVAEREYCPSWAAINPSLTRWVCFQFLKGE